VIGAFLFSIERYVHAVCYRPSYHYYFHLVQFVAAETSFAGYETWKSLGGVNWFVDTLSLTIGINLWCAPQISEHYPYRRPGRLIENLTWFYRPGVASVFTQSLGIVQECSTSAAVTISRTGEFIGSTIRLSVSSSRNVSICWSSSCTMYDSNSSFVKSEYS